MKYIRASPARGSAGIEATSFSVVYTGFKKAVNICIKYFFLLNIMACAVCFLAGSVQGSVTFSQEVSFCSSQGD